jgi:hypothetical protein
MSRPSLDEIKQNLGDQRSWFWWPASSLASPAAFAQKDGASKQRRTRCVRRRHEAGHYHRGDRHYKQGTTGASSRPSTGGDASASDAQTSAPVNNQGTATQPGAAKDGVNQR